MKPGASARAKLHLLISAVLLLPTLNLLTVRRSQNVCTALKTANKRLLHAIHDLPPNISRSEIYSAKLSHDAVRRASTYFLAIASLPQVRSCRPLQQSRKKLEFPLLHSAIEPVLVYLLSVVGARKKIIVALESGAGLGHVPGGVHALLHGWRVIAICQKWSGFEETRRFYDGMDAKVTVIDASSTTAKSRLHSHAGIIDGHVALEGVGGVVDALFLFPERGDELAILRNIGGISLRPRLIAVFFQAYWRSATRLRTGEGVMDDEGRERLFVGASLPALVALAKRVKYRLVWCTTTSPIAFFVDLQAEVAPTLLRDVRVEECFDNSLTWRRDAEAMWDDAQGYNWETLT